MASTRWHPATCMVGLLDDEPADLIAAWVGAAS
jgi:hypothetical protein